jgi:hypothetical protein
VYPAMMIIAHPIPNRTRLAASIRLREARG